ncbi:hypothetical protein BGW41_004102 [Actinomortierella wolfii]|nr:hypothetical protein BGW41_004102 [Actinomortierella wolfii]
MHRQDHDEAFQQNKTRAQQLIALLTATGFPNAANLDAIAIEEHLHAALQHSPQDKAAEQFLDWILDNTSAATNWPAYERPDLQEALLIEDNNSDQDDLDGLDREYESLQMQHDQLQLTLDNLTAELHQLQLQDSEAADAIRSLSTETSDLSVRMDTMLASIEETAHKTIKDSATWHGDLNSPTTSTEYLFQCHEQLTKIRALDEQFLGEMERMINDRLENDPFRVVQQAFQSHEAEHNEGNTTYPQDPDESSIAVSSIFHSLLASDPAMDQEMVELCKLYRSTKMNHLRTVATLKGLEKEVEVLQKINAEWIEAVTRQTQDDQYQASSSLRSSSNAEDKATSPELSASSYALTGKGVQTIAGAKAAALQQMRQNEIALISTQREASRLLEELEQTLSVSAPTTTTTAVPPSMGGSRLSSSAGSTGLGESNGGDELVDISTNMTEIYDKIARGEIELRFLEARYHDYIRSQKAHIAELEKAIDALIDLYGCNQAIALVLRQEQSLIQQTKDTLGSLVMYLGRVPATSTTSTTTSSQFPSGKGENPATTTPDQHRAKNLLADYTEIHQRRAELTQQTKELAREIHSNVTGLSRVQQALEHRLLYRHAATNSEHPQSFTSKQLRHAQEVLSTKSEELQNQVELATRVVNDQIKSHDAH